MLHLHCMKSGPLGAVSEILSSNITKVILTPYAFF